MTKLSDQILTILSEQAGASDRDLADKISGRGKPQQPVNQECRKLESKGVIKRAKKHDGILGNYPTGVQISSAMPIEAINPASQSEDSIKHHISEWLKSSGWDVTVKWGKERGIDILAEKTHQRWIIEAKGIGSYQPMRVNFFLSALAELLQRMDDPKAQYSIALPDVQQYRRLWDRLPLLAKQRTSITAIFVDADGKIEHLDS
jgi:hypothetical protein